MLAANLGFATGKALQQIPLTLQTAGRTKRQHRFLQC
jgi:hypothetical protein